MKRITNAQVRLVSHAFTNAIVGGSFDFIYYKCVI